MFGVRDFVRSSWVSRLVRSVADTNARLQRLQVAIGRVELAIRSRNAKAFVDHEVSVFSQWGEDGLIAHLVDRVPIERPWFIEFGVENYREANTRFLLVSRNWRGLVLDGSEQHIATIREDDISWRHELDAKCAFITRENINQLLSDSGYSGDIGLLSVDIDGNDYWVWEAIDVVSPRIVVAEYNSLFGPDAAVTVPYDAAFVRSRKHHSNLYYGASITALAKLADRKGYDLVGGNSAGNNVFFVRRDVRGTIPTMSPRDAYRKARFREARDERGALTFADFARRVQTIEHLVVDNVATGQQVPIARLGVS
ncbi:hypothetical protein BH11MYX2_BH11MYX2_15120 [soil metagenome]